MATDTSEGRVTAVESEPTRIKQRLAMEDPPVHTSPWEELYGSSADSKGFEERDLSPSERRRAFHPRG